MHAPAWMGRNKDSLLRAANEKGLLTSATRGGSCVHPDQSHDLARKALVRNDLCAGASPPILPFSLGGGVALHEGLMGKNCPNLGLGRTCGLSANSNTWSCYFPESP